MDEIPNLDLLQRAFQLSKGLHAATRCFPRDERFKLAVRINRAGGSLRATVAAACAQGDGAGTATHFRAASAAAGDLETHLMLARDLGLLSDESHARLANDLAELRGMLAELTLYGRTAKPESAPTDEPTPE